VLAGLLLGKPHRSAVFGLLLNEKPKVRTSLELSVLLAVRCRRIETQSTDPDAVFNRQTLIIAVAIARRLEDAPD
jgi:hypothetical protein